MQADKKMRVTDAAIRKIAGNPSSIVELLRESADPAYRQFHSKLIPTVDPSKVLGVRVPVLRRLAQSLRRQAPGLIADFLCQLPHETYDEDMLHAILVNEERDYDACVEKLDAFLPFVDNWAVCDAISPKAFASRPEGLLSCVQGWMASEQPYTVRFGIGVLMRRYLDDGFHPGCIELVSKIRSDEYYVRMMVAWYMATALAKQWDAAIPYLEQRLLGPWERAKSIQKAIESSRVSSERKDYLRSLRTR